MTDARLWKRISRRILSERRRGSDLEKTEVLLPNQAQAGVNDCAVIPCPLVSDDFGDRCVESLGRPVRTMGGHRFDDVRHRDDPGFEKDVVSRQPVGIAGPVELFVMLQDDPGDGPGKGDVLQDVVPGPGVIPQQFEFRLPEQRERKSFRGRG